MDITLHTTLHVSIGPEQDTSYGCSVLVPCMSHLNNISRPDGSHIPSCVIVQKLDQLFDVCVHTGAYACVIMRVCAHVCVCIVYVYSCACACVYAALIMCVHVCVHVHCACACACACVCMHTCECMRVCTRVHSCVCV